MNLVSPYDTLNYKMYVIDSINDKLNIMHTKVDIKVYQKHSYKRATAYKYSAE